MKTFQDWLEFQRHERDRNIENARQAIKTARAELDWIEAQLDLASQDEAFFRIDRVDGVSAQHIFNAFGSIERVAQLERIGAK